MFDWADQCSANSDKDSLDIQADMVTSADQAACVHTDQAIDDHDG